MNYTHHQNNNKEELPNLW